MTSFYDFETVSLQGKPIAFNDFRDKVVLVVNTASKCGFTPQYAGLQKLHEKYADQGLVVIGFPCNQFGNQEPGDAESISGNCLINYGVDFTITHKVEVNGDNADPIFVYLRNALSGLMSNKIKWNFTKFLIGKDGQPIKRYAPTTKPEDIEPDVKKALGT